VYGVVFGRPAGEKAVVAGGASSGVFGMVTCCEAVT
jgi:hypothetical protein